MQRYQVRDLQACEPSALTTSRGISLDWDPEVDSMGFDRVAVSGPTVEAVLNYVRENWGDEDREWFEHIAASIEAVA